MKLFVPLICYNRTCHTDYMWSVFRFVHYCAQQKLDATFYPIFWDSLISRARNAAAAEFLSSDATHLLFIDADISFDPEDVLKLIQSNKDVICSPYPKKYIKDNPNDGRPFEPVDFAVSGSMRKVSEKEYEIQSVATGFLLIKRNVFENLIDKYPEIEYVNDIDGYGPGKVMHDFFRVHINPNTKIYESEDWGFCTLWRNMGGKVYARNDISLGHWGWKEYKGNFNNWIKTLEK
jgi:hypothetical protein